MTVIMEIIILTTKVGIIGTGVIGIETVEGGIITIIMDIEITEGWKITGITEAIPGLG